MLQGRKAAGQGQQGNASHCICIRKQDLWVALQRRLLMLQESKAAGQGQPATASVNGAPLRQGPPADKPAASRMPANRQQPSQPSQQPQAADKGHPQAHQQTRQQSQNVSSKSLATHTLSCGWEHCSIRKSGCHNSEVLGPFCQGWNDIFAYVAFTISGVLQFLAMHGTSAVRR